MTRPVSQAVAKNAPRRKFSLNAMSVTCPYGRGVRIRPLCVCLIISLENDDYLCILDTEMMTHALCITQTHTRTVMISSIPSKAYSVEHLFQVAAYIVN